MKKLQAQIKSIAKNLQVLAGKLEKLDAQIGKAAPAPKKKAAKKKTKRKPNAAFMRPLKPSDDLAKIVGAKSLPRTQVVKQLWVYIKKNKLQDQKNKRMINADANLQKVFGGKKKVSMFEMTKLVSKHIK